VMEKDAAGDPTGRVATQLLPDGTSYQFQYVTVGTGSQVLVTQPNGSVRELLYSSGTAMYPNTDIDGYGSSTPEMHVYGRDPKTQLVTSHTDNAGRITQTGYDGAGRVNAVTQMYGTTEAIGTSALYYPDGDLQSTTDALNNTTTYYYTNRCLTAVVDPLGNTSTATCNTYGQPTSATDALGDTTIFQYEGYDLAAVTDPMGRITTYHHDPLGRLISTTDPQGNTTHVAYDVDGRLQTSDDASGNGTTYTYYADGPVKAVALPNVPPDDAHRCAEADRELDLQRGGQGLDLHRSQEPDHDDAL
jgi:YD repeat-containing protein